MSNLPNSNTLARALAEAAAMKSLAQTLAGLPDDDSRTRVLRWCLEHFRCTVSPSASVSRYEDDRQRPAASSGGVEADPALTIDEDIFDGQPRTDESIHCDGDTIDIEPGADVPEPQRPATTTLGLDSLLRDFVCDFQRLAVECQRA
jgi:hypothetical protein